jgi:hypothetical protein
MIPVVVHWLVAGTPSPRPSITPGTKTPIEDVLHQAMLDFLISLGALLASIAQIVAVFRTLVVATRAQGVQREIIREIQTGYRRQELIMRHFGIVDPEEESPGEKA